MLKISLITYFLGNIWKNTEFEIVNVSGKPDRNWDTKFPTQYIVNDGICSKIVLNTSNISNSQDFYLIINSVNNLQIKVVDSGRSLYFKLNSQTLLGDKIFSENGMIRFYNIKLEEIHLMEAIGDCTNYRVKNDFETYSDCVSNEQYKMFKPFLGCKNPVLSAPRDPDNCKGRVDLGHQLPEFLEMWNEFVVSFLISGDPQTEACLKPCLQLKAEASLINRVKSDADATRVYLNFEKTVKVTSYRRAYGLFDLVIDIGSSLGLWVGISVVGVFDLLLHTAIFVRQMFDP